jgi:hypothetical protein
MSLSSLYIYGDKIVDEACYVRHANLLKILFRLKIINQDQAIDFMMEFRPFIV